MARVSSVQQTAPASPEPVCHVVCAVCGWPRRRREGAQRGELHRACVAREETADVRSVSQMRAQRDLRRARVFSVVWVFCASVVEILSLGACLHRLCLSVIISVSSIPGPAEREIARLRAASKSSHA